MRKLLVVVIVAGSLVAFLVNGGSQASSLGVPPAGLTEYGQTLWNLEALLHDTFGRKQPNLQLGDFGKPEDFSLAFRGDCCSAYFLYTFKNARRSSFQLLRVQKPPPSLVGVSGAEVPLTIRGAYIYCGGGDWLYVHEGNGPANWQLSCHGAKL